ncbi:MAG TPA: amidohydrolase [Bacteroidia bacterium]
MKFAFRFSQLLLIVLFSCACNQKDKADTIVYNARIMTMNDSLPTAQVMVIQSGKIIAIGDSSLLNRFESKDMIDAKKQYVYPGFIDAHCHFYGYAKTLLSCNLEGTKSWQEVLNRLKVFASQNKGEWINGRGWDQNDWADKNYPNNDSLNKLFPNQAVILKRVDGHAAICNQKALELAGISPTTVIEGGEIISDRNELTGVLIDNAVELVENIKSKTDSKVLTEKLIQAEKECFSYGITTMADAGLELSEALFLDSLQKAGKLSVFLYVMLNPTKESFEFARDKGIVETDHLRISSFKLYADGALGSRGAKLKKDYCDRMHHSGYLIHSPVYYDSIVNLYGTQTQYQINTHCIGDSANSLILEAYGKFLKTKNDRRWRIEHAQILDANDMDKFSKFNIVPSVQPTHASSDGPWVEDRICKERMNGAYAYKTLLKQNDYIALGTDFPVEYLQPIFTFYSAVFRESAQHPEYGEFLIGEKLSPIEALKGMTIWAAKACKLEHRKGSLESGKDADFVIMDQNLFEPEKDKVLKSKIIATYSRGIKVY